jgi:Family of unknown function (DUF6622)
MMAQTIQHTPGWVWVLLLALICLGLLQSRTRTVPKARLLVLPLAMLALSLYSLFATFGPLRLGLTAWLVGGMLSLLLHRVLGSPAGAGYAPDTRRYTVPGSWTPLTLMLAIFLARYAVAAATAIDASLLRASALVAAAGLVYGFLSFTFLARARVLMRTAQYAPSGLAGQGA